MRRSLIACAATTYLLTFAVACGDSIPVGVNEGDQLTLGEIQVLFNEMAQALAGAGAAPSVVAPGPNLSPAALVKVNESFNVSAPCESGTVSVGGKVEGSVDDQTFEGDLALEVRLDFDACVVTAEANTITFEGAPEILFLADFEFTQTSMSISGSQDGGFSFMSSDGRVGSCAIELTFSASYDQGTGAESSLVSGTVCNVNVAELDPYPTTPGL